MSITRSTLRVLADQDLKHALKGRSTSGKTRSIWEAVRAKLPDWEFADCRDRAEVGQVVPGSDVVVWLDDLRVTQTPGALAASLRPLLDRRRVLVAATTWPPPTGERHELDELVDLGAVVITVDEEWTQSELRTTANLADRDSRLAIALRHQLRATQVLGGTPWLLRLWEDAHGRPLGAVITAAGQ